MRIASPSRFYAFAALCGLIGEGALLGVLVLAHRHGQESSTLIVLLPVQAALLGLAFGSRAGTLAATLPFALFGVAVIADSGGDVSILGELVGGLVVVLLLAASAFLAGRARERFGRRR